MNSAASVGRLAERRAFGEGVPGIELVALPLPDVAVTPPRVDVRFATVGGVSDLYQWRVRMDRTPLRLDTSLDPPGSVDVAYAAGPAQTSGGTVDTLA